MLADGERLVPGFRRRRALRVWTGVRPLFQDTKEDVASTRDVTRAHAARPRRARRGRPLRDDHRRQVHDLPADGRGDRRRGLPASSASSAPCRTATTPLPGSEVGEHYGLSERLAGARRRCSRTSSSASASSSRGRLEEAMLRRETANMNDLRRVLRLGMGPCQGGFCTYRAAGILHNLDGMSTDKANEALVGFLEERWKGIWPILYGDQVRQARLDDWIYQGVSTWPTSSDDRLPLRRRRGRRRCRRAVCRHPARRVRRERLRGRLRRRLDASGARHRRRARLRARAGRRARPRAAGVRGGEARASVRPAGRGRDRPGARLVRRAHCQTGRSPATHTWAGSSATCCCRPGSACRGRRRSFPRPSAMATSPTRRRSAVGVPRLRDLPCIALRRNLGRPRPSRRGHWSSTSRTAAPRTTRSVWRGSSTIRRFAPASRAGSRSSCGPASASGCPRSSGCAIRTAPSPTSRSGSGTTCSRSPPCRPRRPASACSRP